MDQHKCCVSEQAPALRVLHVYLTGKGRVLGKGASSSNPVSAAGKVDVPVFGIKPKKVEPKVQPKIDLPTPAPKPKITQAAPSIPKAEVCSTRSCNC